MSPNSGKALGRNNSRPLEDLPLDLPPLPPPIAHFHAGMSSQQRDIGRGISHDTNVTDFENCDSDAVALASRFGSMFREASRSRSASPLRSEIVPEIDYPEHEPATVADVGNSPPLADDPQSPPLPTSDLQPQLPPSPPSPPPVQDQTGPYSPILSPWQAHMQDQDETAGRQTLKGPYSSIPIPKELKLPPLLSSRRQRQRQRQRRPGSDFGSGTWSNTALSQQIKPHPGSPADGQSYMPPNSPGLSSVALQGSFSMSARSRRGSSPFMYGGVASPAFSASTDSELALKQAARASRQSFGRRAAPVRPPSSIFIDAPPPEWDPSPLMSEIPMARASTSGKYVTMAFESPPPLGVSDPFAAVGDYDDNSDAFASDAATIRSEMSDFEEANDLSAGRTTRLNQKKSKVQPASWLSMAWQGFTKKKGELIGDDDGDVDDSDDNGPDTQKRGAAARGQAAHSSMGDDGSGDPDLGFTRFDRGLVGHHAQAVLDGSAQATSGPVTSLVEELEIRKASRKAKQQTIARDARALQAEVIEHNRMAHPLDQAAQPTLLELQQLADFEYRERQNWHANALSRREHERAHESLAQRKSRVQALRRRMDVARASESVLEERPAEFGGHETLAERRRRLAAARAVTKAQTAHSDSGSFSEISSLVPPDRHHHQLREQISVDSTLRAVALGFSP